MIALLQLLMAGMASPAHHMHATTVDRGYCHVGWWDTPPLKVPLDGGAEPPNLRAGGIIDGPISENGDFGLVIGTDARTSTASQGSWLLVYVDTMHFRDVQNGVGLSMKHDDADGISRHRTTDSPFKSDVERLATTVSTARISVVLPGSTCTCRVATPRFDCLPCRALAHRWKTAR